VSQQAERWDVVVKVLSGPLAGLGEQVLRGPVVRIGVNPGPGGLQLTGYRGLDARHAVITAYDGGSATIAPVGTNQVRVAPHAHVNWKEIDPISSPQYLNAGGAIHLGPVGRGATLEFVKCQRLGVWTQGNLASQIDDVAAVKARQSGVAPPPAAYDARKVGTIRTSNVPYWFLGCLFMMTSGFASIVVAVGVWQLVLNKEVAKLGPTEEGEYWKDYATVDKQKLAEFGLLEGLEQPFAAFVMKYNIEASGKQKLGKKENWDEEFYDRVAASVYQHVQYRRVFSRFEEIKEEYATVVLAMREAGLPEVFAGVPYRESTYKPDLTSSVCAKGWWQFMPEVAYRAETKGKLDFVVRDCRFKDAPDAKWSPTEITPPRNVKANGKYMSAAGECRISKCDVDDRTDLVKSTAAAAWSLKEPWEDEELRESGALVQITIASHNAGYDDARFGVGKKSNLKPAYKSWKKGVDENEWHKFYGENISCTNEGEEGYCGDSPLHSETQHYVYPIVARHILAVCYYAKNHPEMAAFQPWTDYLEGDNYCTKFNIPDRAAVKK
jgi:hypothetical protein